MPTFSITGKRQQTITQTYVTETDDPAPAIALFKAKYPGLTGVRPTRKKDVTVIAPAPIHATPGVKNLANELTVAPTKKKAAKK